MGAINKNAQLELCRWLSVIQSIYVFTVAVYITESRTYTMNYEVFQEDCGSLRKVSDYFSMSNTLLQLFVFNEHLPNVQCISLYCCS